MVMPSDFKYSSFPRFVGTEKPKDPNLGDIVVFTYEKPSGGQVLMFDGTQWVSVDQEVKAPEENRTKRLKPIICSNCGGSFELKGNKGYCPYCGTHYIYDY